MAEVGTGKRSYLAMLLSMIIPGLGQFYLRKPLKGVILLLGVASAGVLIYISSLPVNSWHDLIRFDALEKWWNARQSENRIMAGSSKDSESVSGGVKEQKAPIYHLHTFNGKLLFRIDLAFQSNLDNRASISMGLRQAFQNNKITLSENTIVSIKKKGSRWLITDENNSQTYSLKKADEQLNVYDIKKLMYRPSSKFKISGFIQAILFWIYAIYDGWKGRRGFNQRAFRRKVKAEGEHHEAEDRE